MVKRIRVQISAAADQGAIDGYAEMFLGILLMSGMLKGQKMSKRLTNERTEIYLDLIVNDAPLGHLGTADMETIE